MQSHPEGIDNVLWLLIDPQKHNIRVALLLSRFDDPDASPDNTDPHWRMENH